MPLSPAEVRAFRLDSASTDLLWQTISRYVSLIRYNLPELGALAGLQGSYSPTAKEIELAKQEVAQPGRYRTQLLHQTYMNINSLLIAAEPALGAINSRETLMAHLGSGALDPYFYPALAQFAPLVVADLIPDEA